MGFERNLGAGEILAQVLVFARLLKEEGGRVSNVVFMGMGEPFLNYPEVMAAVNSLQDPLGFGLGSRRISISTCGVVEGIDRLAEDPREIHLALSLHAPDDELRNRLMSINRKYPISTVLASLERYIFLTGRRVMVEYLLLEGVNDSPEHARSLALLLQKKLKKCFFVNLIACNPVRSYRTSPIERISEFRRVLTEAGISVTQRFRMGRGVRGGCGQLISE
jgi:23S rRNA (adenine2503-C2)-methyltransferase